MKRKDHREQSRVDLGSPFDQRTAAERWGVRKKLLTIRLSQRKCCQVQSNAHVWSNLKATGWRAGQVHLMDTHNSEKHFQAGNTKSYLRTFVPSYLRTFVPSYPYLRTNEGMDTTFVRTFEGRTYIPSYVPFSLSTDQLDIIHSLSRPATVLIAS